MVQMECQRWASKGVNIKYEVRDNRTGYKAGALKEGMKHSYVKECDYVAIFDADFQPDPEFLWRTVPFLMYNAELALVQARWKFGKAFSIFLNLDLLARLHRINLNESLLFGFLPRLDLSSTRVRVEFLKKFPW